MSATVLLGLIFALVCSMTAVISLLMKHRGAVAAPAIDARRPVRTSLPLFRSKWYVLGMLVAIGSWGFHVAALALAPISLVQALIAAGLVFLTAGADRLFGLTITRREVIGVVSAAAGLTILAATLDGGADSAHDQFTTSTLLAYVGSVVGLGLLAAWWAGRVPRGGPLLGVATGCLWGGSDICIKGLAGGLADSTFDTLTHPLVLVIVAASLVGVTVSARSLQVGPPVGAIAMTTAAGSISTIIAGPVVFGEPLPEGIGGISLRVLAFALVIVAATLMPPPAATIPPIEAK